MKNISSYKAEKYADNKDYVPAGEGIYIYRNLPEVTFNAVQRSLKLGGSRGFKYKYGGMLTNDLEPKLYVTSVTFELEPTLGEDGKPSNMPQYPMDDILEKFLVHVSDFYDELNQGSKKLCYRELASPDIKNIQELRKGIIGMHVYNKKNKLVIE